MADRREPQVLVHVVPVENGRQVGWGSGAVAALHDRLDDIRAAIAAGADVVAQSLADLPSAPGWQLNEVKATFGINLTAEGGVILAKATAGAVFEVTALYGRSGG